MNFGFDLDGTITAAPRPFRALIKALHAAGHECHVITGTMDPIVLAAHYERRWAQLAAIGLTEADVLLKIVTNPPLTAKADYCRRHGIALMFEDSPEWSEAILAVCPVLLVMPGNGAMVTS